MLKDETTRKGRWETPLDTVTAGGAERMVRPAL
jgi:hypothetical protein